MGYNEAMPAFYNFIAIIYKGWRTVILGALSLSALFELGLKILAYAHPEVTEKVNILLWQLPLIIIGAAIVGWTAIFVIYCVNAKVHGKTIRYRDDKEQLNELEYLVSKLDKRLNKVEKVILGGKHGQARKRAKGKSNNQ
jgi:hypothetical protein